MNQVVFESMKRDPLFFRLFKELPGCFFHLVGRSERDAQRYALEAIEYKVSPCFTL